MSRRFRRERKATKISFLTDGDHAFTLHHAPQFKNAEQYIQAKLTMLINDFRINPTKEERKYLNDIARESEINHWSNQKTEEAINRVVRQIIINN